MDTNTFLKNFLSVNILQIDFLVYKKLCMYVSVTIECVVTMPATPDLHDQRKTILLGPNSRMVNCEHQCHGESFWISRNNFKHSFPQHLFVVTQWLHRTEGVQFDPLRVE